MSQEPVRISYSLETVLSRLEQKIDKQSEQITKIGERLTNLEVGQARLEEKLTGDIKALDIEVKGINKRLDSQEFINRSVAVGFILAFVTGVIKLFFPNFPNLPH